MGWFRLAGTFSDHPKVIAAGNAAIGLWVRLGCWCAEHETDGFVPEEIARRNGTRRELGALIVSPRAGTRALLEEVNGGYLLRDYLAFNPSHAQQEAAREARAKRQARWRARDPVDASRDASRDATVDTASIPFHSKQVSLSVTNASTAPGRGDDASEAIAWQALHLLADHLATRYAAPDRRRAYANAVIARADEHIDGIRKIARERPSDSAQYVANLYAFGAQKTRAEHSADCGCGGTGWTLDPSGQGVTRCTEVEQ